ncbi:MAG TPA: PaaI family thioesterase [Solirubrobacteraceae bacterium]
MWNPHPPLDRTSAAWRTWADGHPVSVAMGLVCADADADSVTMTLAEPPLPNPNGSMHGGMLAAALDQALAFASLRAMPDGALPNTASMHVQYLRPALAPLTLRARVMKTGQAMIFVRGEVEDREGRVCTTGDATFAVIEAGHATRELPLRSVQGG